MGPKSLLIFALILFISPVSSALVGGEQISEKSLNYNFGIRVQPYSRSFYIPEIPIGPRVALTCGHCSPYAVPMPGFAEKPSTLYIFPAGYKDGERKTNDLYEHLKPGTYTMPFFSEASYPYDLAVIVSDSNMYSPPYVSISRAKVQLGERLVMVGVNAQLSKPQSKCGDADSNNGFGFALFKVEGFYAQKVGFMVSGLGSTVQHVATCHGDSGGYVFRVLDDQNLELVGINSWGHEDGDKEVHDNQDVIFQGNLSGVGDLTSAGIQSWLSKVAQNENLDICGINRECPPVHSPFTWGGWP